jgi:peptide/nickel transport system substrate-binding protein
MVYDTLYGLDANGIAQPQMAEGHTKEDDGRMWRIRLREGLVFHDGTPVRAQDCVASITRWGTHAMMGQSLLRATASLSAPDDRTILFRLTERFPLLPEALGDRTMQLCAIMPARLAEHSDARVVDEVVDGGGWGGAGVELGGLDVYSPLPRIELRYRLGAMASQTLSNCGRN